VLKVRAAGRGQVVVEMLLILPVFLTIVFTIMEMGNLAFQVILLNHATYEVARVAGMTRMPSDYVGGSPLETCEDLIPLMQRVIASASVDCEAEDTFDDLQAGIKNQDIIVTGSYPVPLIFPISNIIMSEPKGSGHRMVRAVVRMPIERPLKK
jgi:hypothetical protein